MMPQDTRVSLPVDRRNQRTNMWCWAASGEMIMDFLGTNVTQCDQANRRFGFTECCNATVPSRCVKGGWPEFSKYGYRSSRTSGTALTWDQIVHQISVRRVPIAFSWKWNGGGGHMMVAYGYAIVDGKRYVLIHDPWPPNVGASKSIPYDEYVAGTNYTHWDDFYDIERSVPFGGETLSDTGVGMSDGSPGSSDVVSRATPAAQQQLTTARSLLFGAAPGGPDDLSLGQALAISVIGLNELQDVQEVADVNLLERDPSRVVFAVSDGAGAPQGEMSLEQTESGWGSATVGSPDLIRRVQEVSAPESEPQQQAVIWVPALNVQFLRVEHGGHTMYVSLVEDESFPKGSMVSTEDLFARLVEAARHHNHLPR